MTEQRGKVYLIGAGPGDVGLLTIKGQKYLSQAEVVVYDRLLNPSLLNHAPSDAEKIYVGKAPNRHALTQDEINELLVTLGRQGKKVVRLKGGDPFVFGRGGEEVLALKDAGIPFEIVPGITSAISVPAYAGIPVTHRGIASTVAFITGNEDPRKESTAINWEGLAKAVDTLVFLMGMANLPHIVSRLLAYGRSPDTPVALVRWGTRAEQQTLVGTLADINGKAQAAVFSNPAIIVVGEVVLLRSLMAWVEKKPLFGRRIVITRPKGQAQSMAEKLTDLGAEVITFPTIEIVPPDDWRPLDKALDSLTDFDWVIFTSVNGVNYFWQRLLEREYDARSLAGLKIAAIGPATARALEKKGIKADWQPQEYVAEAIAAGLGPLLEDKQVLLPRADIARRFLKEELRKQGAKVTEVAAYRTVKNEADVIAIRELFNNRKVSAITFTSSSTVRSFVDLMGKDDALTLMQGIDVFCIGPVTAATAREAGLSVTATARDYTETGLIQALLDCYTQQEAGENN